MKEMTIEQIQNEITAIWHIDYWSDADKKRLYDLEQEWDRRKNEGKN